MNKITEICGGVPITFCIYSDSVTDLRGQITKVKQNITRMPLPHIRVIPRIIIVDRLPGGRRTGGGFWPRDRVLTEWLRRENRTGVSDSDIQEISFVGMLDLIAITTEAFNKTTVHFTVIHEIAHAVDLNLGLIGRGVTINDLTGVRYPAPRKSEYIAEVYARFIINQRRVCRNENIPHGENMRSCSNRLIAILRRSPAFQLIPDNWEPD